MRKTLFSLLFLFSCTLGFSQENPQFTHFLFNRLSYNPGFAGSKDVLSIQALYRQQWQNIEGAPRTSLIGFHTPFADGRCGAGLQLTQDKLGLLNNTIIDGMYSYRLKTGKNSTLNFGVQARMEFNRIAWSQGKTTSGIDNGIPVESERDFKPNFGAGIYYQAKNFFAGVSAPMFLETTLYRGNTDEIPSFRRLRTYYVMTGGEVALTDGIDLLPGMLVSYNPNTPFEIEWNLNALFSRFLLVGVSYRLGDSVDGLIGLQLTRQLRLGFSYDYTLSNLKKYNSGSFEGALEYNFIYATSGVSHLRYF